MVYVFYPKFREIKHASVGINSKLLFNKENALANNSTYLWLHWQCANQLTGELLPPIGLECRSEALNNFTNAIIWP